MPQAWCRGVHPKEYVDVDQETVANLHIAESNCKELSCGCATFHSLLDQLVEFVLLEAFDILQ